MDLWTPPHDSPHLLEWWRPLMLVSRRARAERFPWPVHLDDFRLAGRVRRKGRPDVWIYDHHANGGSVCVDATGETYRFIPTPRANGVGRFQPCPVRTALWRARLPDVVESVSYDDPPLDRESQRALHPAARGAAPVGARHEADVAVAVTGDGGADAGLDDIGPDRRAGRGRPGRPGRVVRRGHLTLIAG